MNTEIEAKFADINHDEMRKTLSAVGAKCAQPKRMMKRVVFHNDEMNAKDAFVRVRNEGHRTTMTYKQFDGANVDSAKELEVVVSDFDTTVAILEKLGHTFDAYQESYRENWEIDDVEISLDEWPWLNPYMEIEGPSENQITAVAATLSLNWDEAIFGGVDDVYLHQYPFIGKEGANIINRKWPEIRFGAELPELIRQD